MGMAWLAGLRNAILIREPKEMILSLSRRLAQISLEYTGLPQLQRLCAYLEETSGRTPPIIDARDLQDAPRETLTLLCEALGVTYSDAMLEWSAGPRATDGAWAKLWYANVEASTGFRPHEAKSEAVPEHLREVLERSQAIYRTLHARRLGNAASP